VILKGEQVNSSKKGVMKVRACRATAIAVERGQKEGRETNAGRGW